MRVPHRTRSAACALLASLALGCSSAAIHSRTPAGRAADTDDATAALAAELADAAALRANLSTMRVSVQELVGKDSDKSYGPIAAARAIELSSLGIALKEELVSALSARMYVLAPPSPDGGSEDSGAEARRPVQARATHRVVGHFMRLEDELLVSLRLVDADSSVIVSSARGAVPLQPLVERGALAWTSPAPPTVDRAHEPEANRDVPSEPGPAGPNRPRRAATSPGPASPGPSTPAPAEVADAAPMAALEATDMSTDDASGPVANDHATESPAVLADVPAEPSVPGPAAIRMRRLSDSED